MIDHEKHHKDIEEAEKRMKERAIPALLNDLKENLLLLNQGIFIFIFKFFYIIFNFFCLIFKFD